MLCTHFDNTGSPKWQQHHIKLSWIWAMFLYFLIPCICGHTSIRGHHIQQYFSLLTTWASFSPEQLLSPPLNTLRKTFPLTESISKAIAKESSKSEICLQLGISKVEHSNIQICSSSFLCRGHFDIPDRTSCIISSPSTSSWKWAIQNRQVLLSKPVLHHAPLIPAGMNTFHWNPQESAGMAQESAGMARNPQEWNWNGTGMDRNGQEWHWNGLKWTFWS